MQRICLIVSLVWACSSEALIPVDDLMGSTVRFYRSPSSQFHSGEATLELLQEKQIGSRIEAWYLVKNNDETEWVSAQNLYYLRDFPEQSLALQTAITRKKSPTLRMKSGWRPSASISAGSTISITSVRSDWACGFDTLGQVCVPTNNLMLAVDLAKRVQDLSGKWHSVKSRDGNLLILANGNRLGLTKLKSWEPDPNVAFIRPASPESGAGYTPPGNAPAYSKVGLIKKQLRRWHQSALPKHGNVFWQKPDVIANSHAIILTSEELNLRRIFDRSTNSPSTNDKIKTGPRTPALVSADGIFLSTDGETWHLLQQFGELNHPVTLGPRNTLVVGDQLSFDNGKTFQSYLRWDQIALQSQNILKHPPKHLRLRSVKTKNRTSLEVDIDTGYKVFVFDFNIVNSQLTYRRHYLKR